MRAVNLIPSEERAGASIGAGRSEGGAYAVLALLGGLAILALLYGLAHHKLASRRAQLASLTVQAQQVQARASQLAPYTRFVAMREQRMQAVSVLVDSRFDWAHAFHEFGRVLPRDVSVSSLDGTITSVSAGAGAGAGAAAAPSSTASSTSSGSAGAGAAAAPSSTASSTSSGSASAPSSAGPSASAASAAAGPAVTSATPPGSVPTFTLAACTAHQTEVALTLDRLRLIDGVSEVTLQSSTKGTGAASAGAGGGCGSGDVTFTVQVGFDPLPSASAVQSAGSKATASAGGAR